MKFVFIGLADEREPRFSDEVLAEIAAGRIFSGGRRHRELVAHLLPQGAEWIDITVPLDAVFERYGGHEQIVVFASGDPLFFGFAATVQRRLPYAAIKIYPAMNSLQTLAHRVKMPYHDMRIVSLTGRPWAEFDRALIEGAVKIGILTDRDHTPAAIAHRMMEYGYAGYEMIVGERLGNRDEERVVRLTLDEAAGDDFAVPNCVIVHGTARRSPFGIPDAEFTPLDGRTRMITKMPVRLTTLSMLGLSDGGVFWDVGFCTGSVSIEARLRFPRVAVHAFEIRPEGALLMEANSRRHGTPGIETHIGDFLDADLDVLPAPDAVFIGGHGGRLEEIVVRAASYLTPCGRLVFNSVTRESRARFEAAIAAAGLTLAARTRVAVDDHNPIEILKAIK
jgi:precorrin-6Y C5,15-methyltransferase (decarboxylating)